MRLAMMGMKITGTRAQTIVFQLPVAMASSGPTGWRESLALRLAMTEITSTSMLV
jgi:hypothetical protein